MAVLPAWSAATTTNPCEATVSTIEADCWRSPPEPWENTTTGNGASSDGGASTVDRSASNATPGMSS